MEINEITPENMMTLPSIDDMNNQISEEEEGINFGEDVPVSPDESLSVITAVLAFQKESEDSRKVRDELSLRNYAANQGIQDWSDKIEGQSTEFVNKTAMALEQISAFTKRGLIAFGNYFQVDLSPDPFVTGKGPLTPSSIVKLLRHRLEDPDEHIPGQIDFPTLVGDAIKIGGLASLAIAKVHGYKVPTRRLSVETVPIYDWVTDPVTNITVAAQTGAEERLVMQEGKVWRLLVELIRPEDLFLDPKNRGLYIIHRTRKDLSEVIDAAEAGEYDIDAVNELTQSFSDYQRDWELEQLTDQPRSTPPSFRKEVEILEFWGNLLDSEGKVVYRNCRCAVANRKYLIRKPEDNPFWHQEFPFVIAPLMRVPFSTWHRAIFDHAVELNLAYNELFNLILDGGIASVHGVKQVKLSMVENADDFTSGIPPGATLNIKEEFPDGQPVFQQLRTGQVPQEALSVLTLLEKEFQAATMINDTKVGQLPRKEVRSAEVAAANEASSAFFDTIISDLENLFIKPILRLSWLTMLQNADDWSTQDVVGCIGPEAAKALGEMSPARRYATYAMGARFKVHGLSSTVSRTRDFQKITALLGLVGQSPMLMQQFFQTYNIKKILAYLFKILNIDPEDMALSEEERTMQMQDMQTLPLFANIARGAQGNQQSQNSPEQQADNPVTQIQAQMAQQNQMPQTPQ